MSPLTRCPKCDEHMAVHSTCSNCGYVWPGSSELQTCDHGIPFEEECPDCSLIPTDEELLNAPPQPDDSRNSNDG